ncbi:MAG: hypothetical protein AMS18_00015 [Gemmatimonas sp. SG8_17]|nr:MAG: hypothetical protein AMS18_00015 [Gemmatimonas sp. SG8_17]
MITFPDHVAMLVGVLAIVAFLFKGIAVIIQIGRSWEAIQQQVSNHIPTALNDIKLRLDSLDCKLRKHERREERYLKIIAHYMRDDDSLINELIEDDNGRGSNKSS